MMVDDRTRLERAETGPAHQLTLLRREHLTMDGAKNVVNFSSEEILLETTAGFMVIKGEDLHIQQLNLDEGRMVVDGLIGSLSYTGEGMSRKGKNLLGRLLR